MKQSVGCPGRLASAHSVRMPLRRNASGIAENTSVSISRGGASRYISFTCISKFRCTIDDSIRTVDGPLLEERALMWGLEGWGWDMVRDGTRAPLHHEGEVSWRRPSTDVLRDRPRRRGCPSARSDASIPECTIRN